MISLATTDDGQFLGNTKGVPESMFHNLDSHWKNMMGHSSEHDSAFFISLAIVSSLITGRSH